MRRFIVGGFIVVGGCLQPNPAYLGLGGTDGATSGGSVGGSMATSSGEASDAGTNADSSSESSGLPETISGCTDGLCFRDARCFDVDVEPSHVVVVDVDGDGRPEIATVSRAGAVVQVWSFDTAAGLVARTQHALSDEPLSVAAVDVDHDGAQELAIGLADAVEIVMPADDARFTFDVPGDVVGIDGGDVDLDGVWDLAVLVGGADGVLWALGAGNGKFEPGPVASVDGSARALTLAFVDDDARPDALVAAVLGAELGCFLSDDEGGFDDGIASQQWRLPRAISSADLDHDGTAEVLISSSWPRMIEILVDAGDYTYDTEESLSLGGSPGELVVVDIDGDGEAEIVTALRGDPELLVYPGTPNFDHGDPVHLELPDDGDALDAGDLDGDGFIDLVATVPAAAQVCVLLSEPS